VSVGGLGLGAEDDAFEAEFGGGTSLPVVRGGGGGGIGLKGDGDFDGLLGLEVVRAEDVGAVEAEVGEVGVLADVSAVFGGFDVDGEMDVGALAQARGAVGKEDFAAADFDDESFGGGVSVGKNAAGADENRVEDFIGVGRLVVEEDEVFDFGGEARSVAACQELWPQPLRSARSCSGNTGRR
jgi:hypothetical protein